MSKASQKLKADPRVEDFENEAMDDGRWMVTLRSGYSVQQSGWEGDVIHGFSVGGAVEGLKRMKEVKPCACNQCQKEQDQ